MIILDCEQGSEEWQKARIGIPTASQFSKIVTKGGAPSASSKPYACQLIAESLLGYPLDDYHSDYMDRGTALEDQAVAYYELQRDVDTTKAGFCMREPSKANGLVEFVGCSPDRLVGDVGGLEIKCPSPQVHVANLLGMATKHRQQVQGALWITGREWWDLLSFHPDLPPELLRVERDEEFIAALEKHVRAFCVGLAEMRERLIGVAA